MMSDGAEKRRCSPSPSTQKSAYSINDVVIVFGIFHLPPSPVGAQSRGPMEFSPLW